MILGGGEDCHDLIREERHVAAVPPFAFPRELLLAVAGEGDHCSKKAAILTIGSDCSAIASTVPSPPVQRSIASLTSVSTGRVRHSPPPGLTSMYQTGLQPGASPAVREGRCRWRPAFTGISTPSLAVKGRCRTSIPRTRDSFSHREAERVPVLDANDREWALAR